MGAPKASAALRLSLDDSRNPRRVQPCPLRLARGKGRLKKLARKVPIPMPCEGGRSMDTGQTGIRIREQLLRRCRRSRWYRRRNPSLGAEYDSELRQPYGSVREMLVPRGSYRAGALSGNVSRPHSFIDLGHRERVGHQPLLEGSNGNPLAAKGLTLIALALERWPQLRQVTIE